MRRALRSRIAAALTAAGVACTASASQGATPDGGIAVRLYRNGAIARPVAITAGRDGSVWFTNERGQPVARITSAGTATALAARVPFAPGSITAGRDGALWVVDGASGIVRIVPGGAVTEYRAPSVFAIAIGADGAVWFTTAGESVGRMTQSGTVTFVESEKLRGTYGIARGPGGAMWVTNYLGSSIARVDRIGAVTSFTAPCIRYPTGITAGPDGALWFGDDSGTIGRITTAGGVTCFGDSTRVGHPTAIAAGADGALWAADRGGSIVRVTTTGRITRYATTGMCRPGAVAATRNGSVWFTDYAANAVGRLQGSWRPTAAAAPRPVPRVTFVSDSVGAAIAFDTGARSLLAQGVDLFLEASAARTLGPGLLDVVGPQTVLELAPQLGRRLGRTVLVAIGHNDSSTTYPANLEAALDAFRAAGVTHVLWTTLHVTPDHTSYARMNEAVAAAAVRHPELTVLDWDAFAGGHPEWFQRDGVHLTGGGPRAFARFLHAGLATLGLPGRTPAACATP